VILWRHSIQRTTFHHDNSWQLTLLFSCLKCRHANSDLLNAAPNVDRLCIQLNAIFVRFLTPVVRTYWLLATTFARQWETTVLACKTCVSDGRQPTGCCTVNHKQAPEMADGSQSHLLQSSRLYNLLTRWRYGNLPLIHRRWSRLFRRPKPQEHYRAGFRTIVKIALSSTKIDISVWDV